MTISTDFWRKALQNSKGIEHKTPINAYKPTQIDHFQIRNLLKKTSLTKNKFRIPLDLTPYSQALLVRRVHDWKLRQAFQKLIAPAFKSHQKTLNLKNSARGVPGKAKFCAEPTSSDVSQKS